MSKDVKRDILGMSKLSHKFQVTIPKEAREEFQLEEGDKLVFVKKDGELLLTKSTEV